MSKAVSPSSKQMHQCVSLAHLGSFSLGFTGLSSNVSVCVWRSCGCASRRGHYQPLYATSTRFGAASPPTNPRWSIHGRHFFNSRSESECAVKRWLHITDLGQNPFGRSDQEAQSVHVCPARSSPSSCSLTFRDANALTVDSGPIRERKTKASIGRLSVDVTRARLHQAPFTWSLLFHIHAN